MRIPLYPAGGFSPYGRTVGVFWPAWCWTHQPWTRWLTSSYDARLAVRDAWRTRRLMQSEWYQRHWGAQFRFASDQNVKGYYANDRTGWRLATSMGGGVTGEHAQYIVVDDPHNVSQAESDLERETVLTTWREVFPSRRVPGGVRVVRPGEEAVFLAPRPVRALFGVGPRWSAEGMGSGLAARERGSGQLAHHTHPVGPCGVRVERNRRGPLAKAVGDVRRVPSTRALNT